MEKSDRKVPQDFFTWLLIASFQWVLFGNFSVVGFYLESLRVPPEGETEEHSGC